jgi:hypothetical protein
MLDGVFAFVLLDTPATAPSCRRRKINIFQRKNACWLGRLGEGGEGAIRTTAFIQLPVIIFDCFI